MARRFVKPEREVVHCEEIDHVRLITLNHPRRLNVITSDLVAVLAKLLENCEKDKDAELILLKGSGRSFCAGGDLKAFYNARATGDFGVAYRMYWLCYHIHSYKKTLVALVDGICFGGGASLMVPMKFSVVTEKTVFATPETSIGYHPDCGLSYMLSRLPGHLGEFLGLTGAKLNGMELVATGLATHFVPSERLTLLQSRLIKLNSGDKNVIKSTIEEFSTDVQIGEESVINRQRQVVIDACFSKDRVEEILTSLENEASKKENLWVAAFLGSLKKSSPTALKITLHSIREARKRTLAECLKTEFRVTMNILRTMISDDIYEGVRAFAVDKNNAPKWDPPTLESVHAENINMVFQPFEDNMELKIPTKDNFRWGGKFEDSPYNANANKDLAQSRL